MSLDVFQQVFSLSLASGGVTGNQGDQVTLQKELRNYVANKLPKIGADWQVAWGPVVWKNVPEDTNSGPDHSWYIAYHPSLEFEDGSMHPTYVVGIAGTAGHSLVDVLEDIGVSAVSDFKAWVDGGIQNKPVIVPARDDKAYIAAGTVSGVYILLTTMTPENAASPGTTFLDFVTNIDKSASPRIVFSGHSLGGALAPSLALALVSAGAIPADTTLTYPTAGPSPGNTLFTELFIQTLPRIKKDGSASYQGWNLNLVNTLDIVPQAWAYDKSISDEQNLQNIPTIYGAPIIPDVQHGIELAIGLAKRSHVQYQPLPSQYFTGTPPSAVPKTRHEFFGIASLQHVRSYLVEVGFRLELAVESQLQLALEHLEEVQEETKKLEGGPEGKVLLGEL